MEIMRHRSREFRCTDRKVNGNSVRQSTIPGDIVHRTMITRAAVRLCACSATVSPLEEECCWISDRRRTERWMNARRKFFWIWADGFMTIRKRYLERKKDWIIIISSVEARFRRIRRRCIFLSMISRRRRCA